MRTCTVEGCDRKYNAKGLCTIHYDRLRKTGSYKKKIKYCLWPECNSTDVKARIPANQYCSDHFWPKILDVSTPITHRHVSHFGYSMVTVLGKVFREHRLVMERHLGRKLTPTENVHHKDGNKMNNALDNLELWIESQPSGQRVSDHIKWALDIIETYGDNPNAF